jgi:glycosyltransferase involved in cell wall biosynthesis
MFPFQRGQKAASARQLLRIASKRHHSLIVMEGTGVAGGAAILLAKWLHRTPYVVSSGDAVAPFLAGRWPIAAPIFSLYERLLYRNCSGFIGWTPYLVGRALTMGAPKGMTAAGWAPYPSTSSELAATRSQIRQRLGIPQDAIVLGIAGSLIWSPRRKYCYGLELVRAILTTKNPTIHLLIVGDGGGLDHLREVAGPNLGKTIFLPGRVPRNEVPHYLAAMDAATLPQSVDNVGNFRYTTKISEYLSVRLPIITNQIPASYDVEYGGLWRLPGQSPWDPVFLRGLTQLMDSLDRKAIEEKRRLIPLEVPLFDRARQVEATTQFIQEILLALKERGA